MEGWQKRIEFSKVGGESYEPDGIFTSTRLRKTLEMKDYSSLQNVFTFVVALIDWRTGHAKTAPVERVHM